MTEQRVQNLLKFFKPQIEGNITLSKFEGFYEDSWMDSIFQIRFKTNRDINNIEVYFSNPAKKSGELEVILNGRCCGDTLNVDSEESKVVLKRECSLLDDTENILMIHSTVPSKPDGDSRNISLLLEKIVFY